MKPLADLLGKVMDRLGPASGKEPAARDARVAPAPGVFDADYVWFHVGRQAGGEQRRKLMAVAAWLWKTGVTELPAVVWILSEGLQQGVRNWYAFYKPGGAIRRDALLRFQRKSAEHERRRTQQWLES